MPRPTSRHAVAGSPAASPQTETGVAIDVRREECRHLVATQVEGPQGDRRPPAPGYDGPVELGLRLCARCLRRPEELELRAEEPISLEMVTPNLGNLFESAEVGPQHDALSIDGDRGRSVGGVGQLAGSLVAPLCDLEATRG
jgi:hypothetical protein